MHASDPDGEPVHVQPDNAIPEDRWLRTLAAGARLTFWSLLLPLLLTNLSGFVFPLMRLDKSQLRWAGLIYTLGGLPLLIGIMMLTARPPGIAHDKSFRFARRMFRLLAVADLLSRLLRSATRFGLFGNDSPDFAIPLTLVTVLWALSGAAYLQLLCVRLHTSKLRRQAWVAAATFIVLTMATLLWEPTSRNLLMAVLSLLFSLSPILLAGFWALVIVYQARRLILLKLAGRCFDCGYSLRGLPEPRCPECGSRDGQDQLTDRIVAEPGA